MSIGGIHLDDKGNTEEDDVNGQEPVVCDDSVVFEVAVDDLLHNYLVSYLSVEATVDSLDVILNGVRIIFLHSVVNFHHVRTW
jgi:hypothetical protein